MRTSEVPNRKEGYEVFKRYRHENAAQPIYDLVSDLHKFAKFYARIVLGKEKDERLAIVWQGLQALRIDAPVPFLLFAMDLQDSGRIDEHELVRVAELIENWVLRRSICDIPSNVLSRTFAKLSRYLDSTGLLDSLGAWLLHRRGRQEFPTDGEFRRALISRNLYHHKVCQHLLTRLENHGRKEPIALGQYTIEHVIPQNEDLPTSWQQMLGPDWQDVQERVLHTLGNLTLTGYNPELSDSPFEKKRDMRGGFKDSPIRLNRSLALQDTWDEAAVNKRAATLADKVLEVWPSPHPTPAMLEQHDPRLRQPAGPESDADDGLVVQFEEPLSSLYQDLEEGLTELGYTPLIQRTQISFQRPGSDYSPGITCAQASGKLRIHLRDELAVPDSIPTWFEPYRTGGGAARIRIDASTTEHVEAVVQHVATLTAAEPMPE